MYKCVLAKIRICKDGIQIVRAEGRVQDMQHRFQLRLTQASKIPKCGETRAESTTIADCHNPGLDYDISALCCGRELPSNR